MSKILKGSPVAEEIRQEIEKELLLYKEKGICAKIAIIRVGEKEEDLAYETRVIRNCEKSGIKTEVISVEENIKIEQFTDIIIGLNQDPNTHGILIFRPLPKQLNEDEIGKLIRYDKDIDCMSLINNAKVFVSDLTGIIPCTPEAVIRILKFYGYNLSGKNVVIVNRSMVVGKPLSMLFLAENSTVTICHSKTKNLSLITSKADIVVTGIGKAHYFKPEYFSEDSIVVDVGINLLNGKISGDVDFDKVVNNVSAITPVPGGVGTVTSMILLRHILKCIRMQQSEEIRADI
ncbi:MAG: bifunctional 5,10-methylenetetrahydrofolate dehydrogenase/5,10-methenyltetrahydrofolate cyclohydrolase [Anaerovoracaceae bacterium]|jgi:methylenetetrahydrofolate dehydrogenase (NADP+)/methenyltetrahydrofolate cyclohydrolase